MTWQSNLLISQIYNFDENLHAYHFLHIIRVEYYYLIVPTAMKAL